MAFLDVANAFDTVRSAQAVLVLVLEVKPGVSYTGVILTLDVVYAFRDRICTNFIAEFTKALVHVP